MLYSHLGHFDTSSLFSMLSNSFSYTRKVYYTAIPPHRRVYFTNVFYISDVKHQYWLWCMWWLNAVWDKIPWLKSSSTLIIHQYDARWTLRPLKASRRSTCQHHNTSCRPVSPSSLVPFPSLHSLPLSLPCILLSLLLFSPHSLNQDVCRYWLAYRFSSSLLACSVKGKKKLNSSSVCTLKPFAFIPISSSRPHSFSLTLLFLCLPSP